MNYYLANTSFCKSLVYLIEKGTNKIGAMNYKHTYIHT